MSHSPKVSVILPAFNAENTILTAIESILKQTFTDFELIIVNDGSTDDTSTIIKAFTDKRVNVFQLDHGGIARALNFGLKVCNGEYVARMDADDYSYPDRLSKQVSHLEKHKNTGLVSCLVEYGGDRTLQMGFAHYVDELNKVISYEDVLNKRFQESPFAHPTVMFRKELVGRYGGYCESSLPEDYELWLRWLSHGVKMDKVAKILYQWKDSETRLSRIHPNYDESKFSIVKAKYFVTWLTKKYKGLLPDIWVWGTGKSVRKRIAPLLSNGIKVKKYIDVKPPPYQNNEIVYYKEMSVTHAQIVLSYVSDRKGRIEIQQFLDNQGFQEGVNYFMMS